MNTTKPNYNLSAPSPSDKPGFVSFKSSENNQYYFHFNDENGKPIFYSEGSASPSKRDNKIKAVKKNAAISKLYKLEKEGKQHYFILRAGNYMEIGRSKFFSSESEMKKTMKYMIEKATAQQTSTTPKSTTKAEKPAPKKKIDQSDEQFALKYSYQIHLYPSNEDKKINGRITNTRTERKETFSGLDGQAIVDFMAKDLIGKMPSLSLTTPKLTEEKQINVKSTLLPKQPNGILLTDPPENLQLKILNKKSGKLINNLFAGMLYEMQLSPKADTKLKFPKTGNKIPIEISIKAIKGSNYSNVWSEEVELSPDGIMRLTSLPSFPYSGIYRMIAKSKKADEKNVLHGISVVNVM